MKDKIDISVIIPMYNASRYIEQAIFSILEQEEHGFNYEIIVVDDASSDSSCEVVQNIKDEKIRLIALEKNGGTAHARNTGLELAQGEWVQFVDSDDRICSDLYKKFERSKTPDANCYLFSIINEYRDCTIKQTILENKDKRSFGIFYSVCNKFIKKDLCVAFKQDFSFEDVCFIVDMMREKELNIITIPDAYYLYNRKNEHSKMANFNQKEYRKMYSYVYSQIDTSDQFTKMYILEIFVGILFARSMPFFMRLQIAAKTLLKLYRYVPAVYGNGIRNWVVNEPTT
jgi:glycosyltransferase involved in cell wall biosynthesis